MEKKYEQLQIYYYFFITILVYSFCSVPIAIVLAPELWIEFAVLY